MIQRADGRRPSELRPIEIVTGYQKHAEGSVLIKVGSTWVLCAATIEEKVPPFVEGRGKGWVTAEYAMLPRATHTRGARQPGGREKEIQRLIGRALRSAVNTTALGPRTITVDCDVIVADGGTRTASVTGAWVALALAIEGLKSRRILAPDASVLTEPMAGVSVGIIAGEPVLDLPYEEDSRADVDLNVIMTESGRLVEVQGTAEGATFGRRDLDCLLDLAASGIQALCRRQRAALEGKLGPGER